MVVGHPGAHISGVGDVRFVHVAGVEFAPDQRKIRTSGGGDLIVNLAHGAADHLVRGICSCVPKRRLRIIAVDVRGDEVHRDVFFYGVLDEAIGPGGLGCGGAADAQSGADFF